MSIRVRGSIALVDLPYRFVVAVTNPVHDLSVIKQGLGGLLIRKIEGDYHNVVGFPAASFFRFLDLLVEEDDDFLEV
jgi:hypothetical protein